MISDCDRLVIHFNACPTSTNVGAPMIKSYGITKKSRRMTIERKLTDISDIDPAEFPDAPPSTINVSLLAIVLISNC